MLPVLWNMAWQWIPRGRSASHQDIPLVNAERYIWWRALLDERCIHFGKSIQREMDPLDASAATARHRSEAMMDYPHKWIRTARHPDLCVCGRPEKDDLHTPYHEHEDDDYCPHGIPRDEFCGNCTGAE